MIFLLFDWLIMPFYIRKDNSVIVMNLQGKSIDRALRELSAEGFKGDVFDTLFTSKVDPETVIDQYPASGAEDPERRLNFVQPPPLLLKSRPAPP